MKRTGVLLSALAMTIALALPALAAGPAWPSGGPPAHAHMLLLKSGRCVDLGSNQVVPINAQHLHMHIGSAGDALRAAGHGVIPTAPISPFANCAALLAAP